MRRRIFVLALPALWGCFLLPGSSDRSKARAFRLDPELHVPPTADRHAYGDVTKLRVGQWATYREPLDRTVTLQVVGQEGDGFWIEVVDEGDPRQVSARLVGTDGAVRKAYYGEISKDGQSRSAVAPQPLEQAGAPKGPKLAESGRKTGEEKVVVGGRELAARRVSIRYEDLDGALLEVITLWHPDVPPIYEGSDAGGLVRKRVGSGTWELIAFGRDAQPLLKIPP